MAATKEVTMDEVREALRDVYDPEIPVNVLDLGLIYDVQLNKGQIYVKMTLTAPGCGMGPLHCPERRVAHCRDRGR